MVCRDFRKCYESGEQTCGNRKAACLQSCDDRKRVVMQERRKKYELVNHERLEILSYRVDEGIIRGTDALKCDGLMIIRDRKRSVLIELKGEDVKRAFSQISATIDALGEMLSGHVIHARIIAKSSPRIWTPEWKKLEKRMKTIDPRATLIIRGNAYAESVADLCV